VDYLDIANSLPMWIAASLAVIVCLCQAILFLRRSWIDGKKVGLTDEQLRAGFRSGAISAVGPAVAILMGMVALLVSLGGAISWMRLSFIGSVMFELMAAGFGTEAVGIELGAPDMNVTAFANAVWTMTLGAVGWLVITGLFTPNMEAIRRKLAGGREALLPVITICAMLGAFAYLSTERILRFDHQTIAWAIGALTMGILLTTARSRNLQWLREWSLGISMFTGMIIASFFM